MISRFLLLFAVLAAMTIAASCAGSRFARGEERLYAGAKIVVVDSGNTVDKKEIEKKVREVLRFKPNKSFFGLYPRLWFQSLALDSVHRGFRAWLKKRWGEAPVYVNDVNPAATAKIMDSRLFNIGIFNGVTTFTLDGNSYNSRVIYRCAVHPPFRIASITYPQGSDSLSVRIAALAPSSLIKTGDPYDLSKLKLERERIDSVLKERGYFYFSPEYLIFDADTSRSSRTADIRLAIKDDIPPESRLTYRIGSITIDPSYSLGRDSSAAPAETTFVDSIVFIGASQIRPAVIARACAFRLNRLYSRRQHRRTLNRLMSMGNFKYAAIQYAERDSAGRGFLDVKILLTPLEQKSLRTELTLVSKSNDFVGPRLDLKYGNRNILGGAEMFNLSLSGSAETQFVGVNKDLFSYEINPQADLNIPRFMIPFFPATVRGAYVPKTKFMAGYSFVRRINFFDAQSLLFTYGFSWRQSPRTSHELNPAVINNLSLFNKSQQFDSAIVSNEYLKRSYEEQFMAGNYYSFTYNEQIMEKQKNQFYFNGTSELSGNALSLAERLFAGRTISAENPISVAGAPYSQFARITLDARNVTNYSRSQKLAVRLYAGIGKAYGNSASLPYAKQFFTGGPTSIRAFQINSVGPGTDTASPGASFLRPGGDLKLEANAEYRFPLIGFLKGAAFVDAGNNWIWQQLKGVDSRAFDIHRFYNEFAVGSGAGLRLDFSFFLLRFDLGVPLRKPWLERWVMDRIDFGDAEWRKNNMVWNIAIGYPF